MELNKLVKNNKKKIRVGRGIGSGRGKTSSRGHKGQKSRSGVSINGFEGGQMPIHRRLPKRGFKKYNRATYKILNLGDIQNIIDKGKIDPNKEINNKIIISSGIFSNIKDGIRVLARGEIKNKVNIIVNGASKAAVEKVRKAGGSIKILQNKEITKDSK